MLSDAYAVAQWAEYILAGLAVLCLLAVIVRLSRKPRRQVLGPGIALVVTGALAIGCSVFLGTRFVQVKLDSIKQVGLELKHAGLRTNALRYDTQVTITAELRAPGVLGKVTSFLIHKNTSVATQVAVYGLIDFTTVDSKVATVDRRARTISLSLPNPEIGKNTTYIASVNGVQQHDGPVTAVADGIGGLVRSLFGLPVVSVDPRPALLLAEARALKNARTSSVLATCGKEEIVSQLTGIFHLTPAYRGYTVHVHWPVPPDPSVNCQAEQAKFIKSGT